MRKPAFLVIFAIVGQKAFRDNTEQLAARDNQRAVIDPSIVPKRRSDQQDRVKVRACGNDPANTSFGCIKQCRLQMQIIDRIG